MWTAARLTAAVGPVPLDDQVFSGSFDAAACVGMTPFTKMRSPGSDDAFECRSWAYGSVDLLGMESAAIVDLAAQGVDAAGTSRILPAAGQVGPVVLPGWLKRVNPLAEALRGQELLQGERDRDRLIVEGGKRRQ